MVTRDSNSINNRRRILSAYKGFVLSHKLEPYDARKANEERKYHATFNFYDTDEGLRQLYIERQSVDKVLSLLERMLPEKTDRTLSQRLLLESLDAWITSGETNEDNYKIESFGNQFIDDIAKEVRQYSVYVPLFGINLQTSNPIKIGSCTLSVNTPGSEYFNLPLNKLKRIRRFQEMTLSYLKPRLQFSRFTLMLI